MKVTGGAARNQLSTLNWRSLDGAATDRSEPTNPGGRGVLAQYCSACAGEAGYATVFRRAMAFCSIECAETLPGHRPG